MKLIIAGSRTINPCHRAMDFLYWQSLQKVGETVEEVVSGGANGIDKCGEELADMYKMSIKRFPANWNAHGKAAGPIRNKQMAEYADALLLIWDGESRGSANMKKEMTKLNKPVYEVIIRGAK